MNMITSIALEDKYERIDGRAYITGMQALVLACLMRHRVDRCNKHNTAGFISGYRGSPVGTLDNELWSAQKHLEKHDIVFQPGINEDLAATSVWGSQQVNLHGPSKYDGVYGMWYGKGAGLDRCGDVMRHAHGAGVMPLGGVLAVSGDDHTLKSSSQAYHCEPFFMDMLMPVLYPADIQEIVDYAVLGWELSRYSGCWVGFKVLAEGVNSTSSIDLDLSRYSYHYPDQSFLPQNRHIRWPDPWPDVEKRLYEAKLPAALEFAKANRINRTISISANPRLGIVTTGKSYLDVLEALRMLGLTLDGAAAQGVSLFKIGMPWPLEPSAIRPFLERHEKIFVIEEKRGLIETQIKDLIYNAPAGRRPQVIGRRDEDGTPLMPYVQEISPELIAREVFKRLPEIQDREEVKRRICADEKNSVGEKLPIAVREPYFCSGCPHNSSTKLPKGSKALAGVGCHYMAVGMDRETQTFTQMGGEGVPWIGAEPFSETSHMFVNIGEGTYFHSGVLAIRACIAAKTNITFKILFNDAVAMTGGQPVDGQLTVPKIIAQMHGEGVERIEVVTDDLDRYGATPLPKGVSVHHRDDLNIVQEELRETKGVSVLIYDQECATEKRRRRKRGLMEDPPKRIFINEHVCEGCGDCSEASNCLSVVPKETKLGRKRKIDQSACNKDYSCVKGFCPSFVAVIGGELDKSPKDKVSLPIDELPVPPVADIKKGNSYNILITGVGGSGVVTIGALIGMAAHLEGKGFVVHDRLGMAQKFGGVTSHVRVALDAGDLHSVRIPAENANLVIGGDLHVTALPATLTHVHAKNTHILLNTNQMVTGEFPRNLSFDFKNRQLIERVSEAVKTDIDLAPATDIAVALTGDAIAANMFLLGYVLQKGWLPVALESIERAIEMNGIAVEANKRALALGRYGALNLSSLKKLIKENSDTAPADVKTLPDIIDDRAKYLEQYQNLAYAQRYLNFVERVKVAEEAVIGKVGDLTKNAAKYLFKLMAYKDEYEVARLHTETDFLSDIKTQIKGEYEIKFYMAPPLLSKNDPYTGHPLKREFGSWILPAMRVLRRLKFLRGTKFDVFGYTHERRQERALVTEYEQLIDYIVKNLTPLNLTIARELLSLPEDIRGYGHVKERNIAAARERQKVLFEDFTNTLAEKNVHAAE